MSLGTRVVLWCASIAIVTGTLGVLVTLAVTDARLRDAARFPLVVGGGPPAAPAGAQGPPRPDAPSGADQGATGPAPLDLTTPGGRAAEGARVRRVLDGSRGIGLATVLVLSAGSLAASWFAAGRMLAPIRSMAAMAREVSQPGSGRRLGLGGPPDQLRELADTLDAMLDRLDAAFDSHRRFVADASHELKTPLAVLRSGIDVALHDPGRSEAELRATLVDAGAQAERLGRLVDALLQLARSQTIVTREHHDLADAAEQAIGAVRRLGFTDRTWQRSLSSAPVHGDAVLIDRLVVNLVENAARHNRAGGLVHVATSAGPEGSRLVVENDGPPVSPAEISALTERFRRGVSREDGHGLGLAIARMVAETHGGRLDIGSRRGGGLVVVVDLPPSVAQPPSSAA